MFNEGQVRLLSILNKVEISGLKAGDVLTGLNDEGVGADCFSKTWAMAQVPGNLAAIPAPNRTPYEPTARNDSSALNNSTTFLQLLSWNGSCQNTLEIVLNESSKP